MLRRIFINAILILLVSTAAFAQTIKCAECGMMVDRESKFASKIVQGDKTLFFCDIGDLLVYLKKKNLSDITAHVKDYKSGEWIDAYKACYVQSEKEFKTPMAWGIAAFKNRADASEFGNPMDFEGVRKTIK